MSVALVYGRNVFATGVERYARSLGSALREAGEAVQSVPLTRREIRVLGRAVGGFASLWLARTVARRGPHDVIHALDPAVATRHSDVVTVHDLVVETYPEWYQRDVASRLDWALTRRIARRAPRIIAVSETTRREILARWAVPAERVITVPSGIDHAKFRPVQGPAPALSENRPNLVYVGDDNPRKNLLLAVQAVAELRTRHGTEARLVRIGPDRFPGVSGRYRAEARRLGVDLVEPGFLSDDELVASLTRADAFVWPSVAEGFGFPPLEAMACGTPVVALDTPINREVCEDLARYHGPDASSAASALHATLTSPPAKNDLLAHAARYTWRSAALATRKVYDQVRSA